MRYSLKPGKPHSFNIQKETSIYLINELGDPLKNRKVDVEFEDGRVLNLQTDSKGCLKDVLSKGNIKKIVVEDVHEVEYGEGIKTESGQHFEQFK